LLLRIKLAANRAKEARISLEETKSVLNFMKIYSGYLEVYNRVREEFIKAVGGERIMTADEVREWFSEKKLREIFGQEFKEEWLAD
jgi:hypothetical protein